ncbi:hypothetical protein FRB99_000002 [Tulasnella sp. 403]|nr:hypothetical protein FRB99_000002 [Tulasnella sp. 403]
MATTTTTRRSSRAHPGISLPLNPSPLSNNPSTEPTPHVDLEYPSSVPTFTVNPTQLSSSNTPLPWFSAFGRKDANAPLPSAIDPKYSDPAYYASSSTYGKNGRNTSHTAKKPEGHIKRPPNCFLLFRSHVKEAGIRIPEALKPILKDRLREKRREQRAKKGLNPDEDDDEDDEDDEENDDDEQSVSKISGILWDFLPAAEKSFFRARAAHAKAQHKKLYPNYKYSPQVKDKSVKRRVGKKMPTEKRERLEEVAGVLVREMGWASGDVKQRSATPSSIKNASDDLPSNTNYATNATMGVSMPGTSAFGIPGYEHSTHHVHPQKTGSAPPPSSYGVPSTSSAASYPFAHGYHDDQYAPVYPPTSSMGVPMSLVDHSAPGPRMERRPSSCPPVGAHLAWDDPTAYSMSAAAGQMYTPPPTGTQQASQAPHHFTHHQPVPAWTYPASGQPPLTYSPQSQQHAALPPPAHAFVRPGGKTVRKMRTGVPSAKAQILNGKPATTMATRSSRKAATPNSGGMTLPSLPSIVKGIPPAGEVPMTTGTQQAGADAGWIPANGNIGPFDIPSQHSSPQTFSSSAPPSLLETPPFTNQLQMGYPTHSTSLPASQGYDYSHPGSQPPPLQPAFGYVDGFVPLKPASTGVPEPASEEGTGGLRLTIIDQNYTFPPPPSSTSPGVGGQSPKSRPVDGGRVSPPKAPSQREKVSKWTKPHHHSPLGRHSPIAARKTGSGLRNASPPGSDGQQRYTPPPVSSAQPTQNLISPTPITPITLSFAQQGALPPVSSASHGVASSLDDLGVDLNLPPGMDVPDMNGLLEFHFPSSAQGQQYAPHQAQALPEGGMPYALVGANPHVLLGDVALGMHEDQDGQQAQQYQYPPQQYMPSQEGIGPLDVPLNALYGADDGSGPVLESFDPSTYIADDSVGAVGEQLTAAAVEEMSSSQQLEYEMMEWRRGSGSTAHGGTRADADYASRRPSVSVGMTLGTDVGMALYGFDTAHAAHPSAQPTEVASSHDANTPRAYDLASPATVSAYGGLNVGMEFQFEAGPPPTAAGQHEVYAGVPPSFHAYQLGPPALGTVVEERASSEEVEADRRAMGSWVASSA